MKSIIFVTTTTHQWPYTPPYHDTNTPWPLSFQLISVSYRPGNLNTYLGIIMYLRSLAICWMLIPMSNWEWRMWIYIMVCTKKAVVTSLIHWKICWILVTYASWSSIHVASNLSARSFNSFISFWRILDGDMLLMISFWCTKDDVQFEILHRLFSSLWNRANYHPLHS